MATVTRPVNYQGFNDAGFGPISPGEEQEFTNAGQPAGMVNWFSVDALQFESGNTAALVVTSSWMSLDVNQQDPTHSTYTVHLKVKNIGPSTVFLFFINWCFVKAP